MQTIQQSQQLLAVNGIHMNALLAEADGERRGTLVLLHGFTGSATGWGEHLVRFTAAGLRVVALDMLGHGRSDAPADPQRYSIEHCREDILMALGQLGVQSGESTLLGYSMGGRIALYTAFSGYFRALILESASPGLASAAERKTRRISDEALADRIEREGIEPFVAYWESLPLFASQCELPVERQAVLHAVRLRNRPEGLANSLRGVGTATQPALHEHLSELTLPVLLLAGELDSKYSAIAQAMAEQLSHAQLLIVSGAGHSVHFEQPEQFDTMVVEFCLVESAKSLKGAANV